jgi:hypothetical protein
MCSKEFTVEWITQFVDYSDSFAMSMTIQLALNVWPFTTNLKNPFYIISVDQKSIEHVIFLFLCLYQLTLTIF